MRHGFLLEVFEGPSSGGNEQRLAGHRVIEGDLFIAAAYFLKK